MKKNKCISVVAALSVATMLTGCSLSEISNNNDSTDDKISIQKDGTATDSDSTLSSADLFEDDEVNAKIDEIEKYIDAYFYFDTDKDYQEESIYDGIMEGLDDPYSVYYTEEEYDQLMEDDSGEYCGIGAVVTQDADMNVSVVRPIENSPAEEAGLQAGDIIVEVNDMVASDYELSLVVKEIRGEEGTVAHLKVYREGESDYLYFDITRRTVENVSVTSEVLDNNLGYIQVEQFYENTDEEFEEKFDELLAEGVDGVIIDLRDNPGGLLDSVVNMCDYIMGEGTIVTVKDRDDNVIQEYTSSADSEVDIPMVVLVNGNSASASEIFTGAMKDTGKAEIVGTTTYGKGIVQSVIPLSDGSAIKLTIAKYFTPAGNDIHKTGIEPDYVVELKDGRLNAVNLDREEDLQLQKAEELLTK
jgi:carboxyl-terminal processing protease